MLASRFDSSVVSSVNRFWPSGMASAARTASSDVHVTPLTSVRLRAKAPELVAP